MIPPLTPQPRRRRSSRQLLTLSARRSVYEWTAILLLISASTVGVILFGAVRNWSAGSLMVLVFLGIALYLARPLLEPGLRQINIPPGGLLFLLFLAYAVALIPWSSVPYESKVEALKIASYVGAYWAWTELASHNKRWRIILFIPLLIGVLVALYALVLHAQGSNMVLWMERHEGYGMRASGTFRAPAHMGAYMGTIICLSLTLVLMKSAGGFLRVFSGYSLLMCLPALLLSGSRSGWVGTAVGVPLILLMVAWRRSLRAFCVMLVLLPLLGGALLATLWFASPMFQERAQAAVRIEGTAAWRVEAWKDTLEMAGDRPLLGYGPGTYRWMYPRYQTWSGYRWLRYAHNEYLHLLAEYGAVGLLLMAAFILTLLARCLWLFQKAKTQRDAYLIAGFTGVLGAALGHAVFDFNLHVFSLVHLLALIGGVTMACLFRSGLLEARRLPFPLWGYCGGGLLLASLGAMVISFQVASSGALTRLAEDRLGEMDLRTMRLYERSRELNQQAALVDPSNWQPRLALADIKRREAAMILDPDYRRETFEEALALYEQAYQRNPYDMNVVYGLGRCWFHLGEEEKSLEYLRRAVEHWPSNVYYSMQLGLQLRQMGRNEEALEALEHARRAGGWADPLINPRLRENIRQLQEQLREQ